MENIKLFIGCLLCFGCCMVVLCMFFGIIPIGIKMDIPIFALISAVGSYLISKDKD